MDKLKYIWNHHTENSSYFNKRDFLKKDFPYPGNGLDLNGLAVVLTIVLTQDYKVKWWTDKKVDLLNNYLIRTIIIDTFFKCLAVGDIY